MSVRDTLKCLPLIRLKTAEGSPVVAVSCTNATLFFPGVEVAAAARLRVAFPEADCPRNKRCPTTESTDRYAQTTVGVVSLSHATHRFPPSAGIEPLRASIAAAWEASVDQNFVPQGAADAVIGSPLTAAIAIDGKTADDPTAMICGVCALLAAAKSIVPASAKPAVQSFLKFISLFSSQSERLKFRTRLACPACPFEGNPRLAPLG